MIPTLASKTSRNLIRFLILAFPILLILVGIISCTSTETNVLDQAKKPKLSPTSTPVFHVVSINATSYDCYFGDPLIIGEINSSAYMPNISNFYQALNKIPVPLMQVMNNKTFYLSYRTGSSYAVLDSWPERHILSKVDRGCILEQPITESSVLHEFAHILDYQGIRGVYEDPEDWWTNLETIRSRLFNEDIPPIYNPHLEYPPPGFVDVYATANEAENFAEHFAAYILESEKFRNLASNSELLSRKYIFFKYFLFNGREYGNPAETTR